MDRACADEAWRDLFPHSQVVHLASPCSDHCPVLVRLNDMETQRSRPSPRYEIMWERHPALVDLVAGTWADRRLAGNLSLVRDALQTWSKENFGHVVQDIEKLRKELAKLQLDDADRAVIKQKMHQMDELLYREEMMWLQRSHITWLKEVERNTSYLHRRAVWRARRNNIQKLRREDGTWCSVPSYMERMATSYFKEVYTKNPTLTPEVVLECINPKVTDGMNGSLCAVFFSRTVGV